MEIWRVFGRQEAAKARGLSKLAVMCFITLFVVVVYTFLHESGHTMIGLLLGGTITSFSISFWDLGAHVGIDGSFSDAQRSLIALAGATLPLLVWGAFLAFVPRKVSTGMAWLRAIGSLAVLNSLLAWIILPFPYLMGQAPGDDVVSLINHSRLHPLLVAGVSLMAYLGGWALLLSKVGGLRNLLAELRGQHEDPFAPGSRHALLMMSLIGATVVVLAVSADLYLTRSTPPGLPPGYSSAAMIDLSQRSYSNETVYRFTLDQPARVSLYILLRNVNSGPVEISLVGLNQYRVTFLRFDKDFKVGRASVHPQELSLEKGEYEVRFTFPRTLGQVSIYVKVDTPESNTGMLSTGTSLSEQARELLMAGDALLPED